MNITTGREIKTLNCLSVVEVIDIDVEVASDDEFVRGGGCVGNNAEYWLRKVENKVMDGWSVDVEQCELSACEF